MLSDYRAMGVAELKKHKRVLQSVIKCKTNDEAVRDSARHILRHVQMCLNWAQQREDAEAARLSHIRQFKGIGDALRWMSPF